MCLSFVHVAVEVLFLLFSIVVLFFFFFKQKTAYEMRISDWSSDVCSSDLSRRHAFPNDAEVPAGRNRPSSDEQPHGWLSQRLCHEASAELPRMARGWTCRACHRARPRCACPGQYSEFAGDLLERRLHPGRHWRSRSEEHTSELQSLMRISYAVIG